MLIKKSFHSGLQKDKAVLQRILSLAEIEINGKNPWDMQVHDDRLYRRIISNPSLGAGESWMDGWWDCVQLDAFFSRVLCARLHHEFKDDWHVIFRYLKNCFMNLQTRERAIQVAKIHYNLDNQLYQHMLGPTMAYTCGYWQNAHDLEHAQNQKYDLICRKLALKESDHVLELGCGYGGFARFAAMNYGCKLTCVNISEQQILFAREICTGLPVTLFQTDYRNKFLYNPHEKQFDHVVSIGMCEHIGNKNYAEFIRLVYSQLKNKGLFLLHTIGNNTSVNYLDPWINKYIFPNGFLPSIQHLGLAMENFFIMEDWHNFGTDYDKTLMAWHGNFQHHWPELSTRYEPRFYRMWVYYLLSCAGMFRAREGQLWQIVLSKGRGQAGYMRVC